MPDAWHIVLRKANHEQLKEFIKPFWLSQGNLKGKFDKENLWLSQGNLKGKFDKENLWLSLYSMRQVGEKSHFPKSKKLFLEVRRRQFDLIYTVRRIAWLGL